MRKSKSSSPTTVVIGMFYGLPKGRVWRSIGGGPEGVYGYDQYGKSVAFSQAECEAMLKEGKIVPLDHVRDFPSAEDPRLPYVFDSVAHMRRALDGGLADAVLDGFAARDLVGLAVYDSGARCFYNTKHPIVTPKDLHGLKLRVANSDIFIELVRLLGANPTPMSLGDTFSGMETHMIDGAENNMRSFHSSRHFEAAKFWSQTEHSYAPDILLLSRRTYDELAPDDRALLRDTARASVVVMRAKWDESEGKARQAVLDAGIRSNEVDMAAFRDVARPLRDRYLQQPEIQTLYRRIRDVA